MKCRYCDRVAAYKKKELCHTHYNKFMYRLEHGIPAKDLRTDFRRISAINCKKCGKERFNGTTNVLCHECFLAYTKVVNRNRSVRKKRAYNQQYYKKNEEKIKKWKAQWFQKRKLQQYLQSYS